MIFFINRPYINLQITILCTSSMKYRTIYPLYVLHVDLKRKVEMAPEWPMMDYITYSNRLRKYELIVILQI